MNAMKRFYALALALCITLALMTTASAVETAFSDVDAEGPYAEAIQWAAENGYINGYSDGRFGVGDNVTRAQMAAIFHRSAGSPAASGTTRFSDVPAAAYYVNAAAWAADSGLVNGYADGRFGVNDPVTRQQMIAILWRWAGSPEASSEDYPDENAIASYAQTAADWSQANNILAARADGRFDPQTPATRAEVVSALYQYRNLSGSEPSTSVPDPNETQDNSTDNEGETAMNKITLSFNGHSYTATLADNSSAEALKEILANGPLTIEMSDYGNMEKVGPIGRSLPTNNEQINTQAGDLILYQGSNLVIYYSTNSWNFTRLGKLDGNLSNLKADLGNGDVSVTLTLG